MASLLFFPIALFLASPLCIKLLLCYPRIKIEWGQESHAFCSSSVSIKLLIIPSTSPGEQEMQGPCFNKSHMVVGEITNEDGKIGR